MPSVTSPRKRVVVTGGRGFVGSNFVVHLLEEDNQIEVVVLDSQDASENTDEVFARFGDRVRTAAADLTDGEAVRAALANVRCTHVVHTAALTNTAEGEARDSRRFVEVNVLGALNMLEWASGQEALRRFVIISSGAVYGEPETPPTVAAQSEDGPFEPRDMYGISKLAGEFLAHRYGELFGFDVRSARPSSAFGPMERPTEARKLMSLPFHLARAAFRERVVRITRRSLDAGGDFIYVRDLAVAVGRITFAETLQHGVYNVASGRYCTVRDLLDAVASIAPQVRIELVDDASEADVDLDPRRRHGGRGPYDISRLRDDVGWRPRPLSDQLQDYLDWVKLDPTSRCP